MTHKHKYTWGFYWLVLISRCHLLLHHSVLNVEVINRSHMFSMTSRCTMHCVGDGHNSGATQSSSRIMEGSGRTCKLHTGPPWNRLSKNPVWYFNYVLMFCHMRHLANEELDLCSRCSLNSCGGQRANVKAMGRKIRSSVVKSVSSHEM